MRNKAFRKLPMLCLISLLSMDKVSADDSSIDAKEEVTASDYAGGYAGIGVSFSRQQTEADANNEFEGAKSSFDSNILGGTMTLGYNHRVRNSNFSMGIEGGIDFGKERRQVVLGGRLNSDSRIMGHYNLLEDIARQSITKIADNLRDAAMTDDMNLSAYSNFVRAVRYLGGTDNGFNGNVFMTASGSGGGLPAVNATFFDFIGGNAYNNIVRLGDGNIGVGYTRLREFIIANYPNFAGALTHLSETKMMESGSALGICSAIDGDGSMSAYSAGLVAGQVRDFLDNDGMSNWEDLGMSGGATPIDQNIIDDLDDIYNPSNIGATSRLNRAELDRLSQLKNSTSFGVCPYVSLKFGYFIPEIKSNLYVKVGCMQLKGSVASVNDYIGVKEDFSKVAPFLGVGLSKMFGKKLGVALEYTQTLKVNKKFKDIEYYGYKISNKVSLKKTDLRILVTYTFSL